MSIFLQFGSVLGDAQDAGHTNWIEIQSVQWGLNRPVTNPAGSTAGRTLAAPQLSELVVSKAQDVASIPLIQAALEGSPVAAQIDFCSTGTNEQKVYYTINMTSTVIVSFGQSGAGDRPMESMTFNFTEIAFTGTQMDPDGSSTSPSSYGWNISSNSST
jgi:type VI secretion system secreted protein Hcp